MRAVVQRVSEASVTVESRIIGQIRRGLVVLLGVEEGDGAQDMRYMADKVPCMRIFEDDAGKMNRSLLDTGGSLLVVSQFTLLGDVRGGRRPSFTAAAKTEAAVPLYAELVEHWRGQGIHVETGAFGAEMDVGLVNDGPVTILLDSRKRF